MNGINLRARQEIFETTDITGGGGRNTLNDGDVPDGRWGDVPAERVLPPDSAQAKALVYDFRRPDRIAKDQLRAIHLLHENFCRSLASSLSAYLRAFVAVNLVSVEQLSFMEFSQCLPSPSCLVSLGLQPYEGKAVLEINPGLVFPI